VKTWKQVVWPQNRSFNKDTEIMVWPLIYYAWTKIIHDTQAYWWVLLIKCVYHIELSWGQSEILRRLRCTSEKITRNRTYSPPNLNAAQQVQWTSSLAIFFARTGKKWMWLVGDDVSVCRQPIKLLYSALARAKSPCKTGSIHSDGWLAVALELTPKYVTSHEIQELNLTPHPPNRQALVGWKNRIYGL
jgi:hypothetical protein